MARDLTAKIKLEADTRAAAREFDTFKRDIIASLNAISATDIDVDTSESESNVQELERLLERLNALDVSPEVDVDTKAADDSLESLIKDFKAIENRTVSASVDVNASQAESSLEQVNAGLSEIDGRTVTSDVLANTVNAETDLSVISDQLAQIDATQVTADVTANTADAKKGLEETSEASDGLVTSFGALRTSVVAVLAGFAAAGTAFAVTIGAAAMQQQANALLSSSLKDLEESERAATVASLNRHAVGLQGITNFSKLQLTATQQSISAFTNEEETIKALTAAAADLSAATGRDIVELGNAIARSFGTANNALLETGVITEGVSGSMTRLSSILEGVERLAGGSAAAAARDFSGALRGITSAGGLVAEAIGRLVTENERLRDSLKESQGILEETNTELDETTSSADTFVTAINGAAAAVNRFFFRMGPTGIALSELNKIEKNATRVVREVALENETFGKILSALRITIKDVTSEEEKRAAAQEKALGRTQRIIKAESDLASQLGALGFVLRRDLIQNVNNAEAALELARQGVRLFILDTTELTRAERDLAQAQAALRGETLKGAIATEAAADSTDTFAQRLMEAREAVEGLTDSKRVFTQVTLESSAAIERESNLLGGPSGFSQIGGGVFTIDEATIVGVNGRVTRLSIPTAPVRFA